MSKRKGKPKNDKNNDYRPVVGFAPLGCAKATVDSEKMLAQIAEAGCPLTSDLEEAEVIVVNTCGFLADARSEAHEMLEKAVTAKITGKCRRVVAAGCLVQRDGIKLFRDVDGIDAIVGVHNRDDVVRAVLGTGREYLGDYAPYTNLDNARLRITPRHYTYLRISEGCDQKCTFCTIPAIRGTMHSKPPHIILEEARELISDGAVELNIIAQDTTAYGRDIHTPQGLSGLLRQLNALEGVGWIRLLYAYPTTFTDDIIAALAECENVVKYLDIPLQHINDNVLKRMGRQIDRATTEKLLQKIRDRVPGIAIRTTMISGFPGESKDEYNELKQFIRDFRFDALGVFPYSHEPDTASAKLPDQIPEEQRQERADELMEIQQDVAFELAKSKIGTRFDVLVEDEETEDGLLFARHAGQAPEVDSVTFIENSDAAPGSIITVECTERDEYDLVAKPV